MRVKLEPRGLTRALFYDNTLELEFYDFSTPGGASRGTRLTGRADPQSRGPPQPPRARSGPRIELPGRRCLASLAALFRMRPKSVARSLT